jgi:Tfp pilus assembly protein PilO
MLANRKVLWSLGTAFLCLILLAAGYFLLIDPRRSKATDLHDAALASDSQATVLQVQIAKLMSQAAELPEEKRKLEEITTQLTSDAGLPVFVRQMQGIAATAGVELTAITPVTPAQVVTDEAAATPDASSTAAPGALIGIPMTMSVSGDYFQASQFLKDLQTKVVRSFLVNGLTVTEEEVSTDVSGGSSDGTSSGTSAGAPADGSVLSGAAVAGGTRLSGAAIADGAPATSTAKGNEGVTPTAGATATATSGSGGTTGGTTGGTSGGTATTAPTTPGSVSTTDTTTVTETVTTLDITGQIYVLLNGTATLADIEKQAAALAAAGAIPTPGATGTATPSTAVTTAPAPTAS